MSSVILATEIRLIGHEGRYWSNHGALSAERLGPFLAAFENAVIFARVTKGVPSTDFFEIDLRSIRVVELPNYRGLRGLIANSGRIFNLMREDFGRSCLYSGRLPEPLSLLLFLAARQRRAGWLSQVVSEPRELGRSLSVGPVGALTGFALAAITKYCVRHSGGVVYVTRRTLQEKYPAPQGVPTMARSNVRLPTDVFVAAPRQELVSRDGRLRMITIGSLSGRVKGVDAAIEVLRRIRAQGHDASLEVVGAGADLETLRRLAIEFNVGDHVTFSGHIVSAREVRRRLDSADIYLSCSRAEGLSRAMLEAMARALPVVGTDCGGTAEILLPSQLARVDDIDGLVSAVNATVNSPSLYGSASAASLRESSSLAASLDESAFVSFLKSLVNKTTVNKGSQS